jgi:prepilin signal peptidase PulO-like enzyme (type II secretory pathway)
VNLALNLDLVVRLIVLATVGAYLGTQINRAIYRWAFQRRLISPWSPPPEGVEPRRWHDRLPIVGWWFLRREASVHGRWFWARPLLIELAMALGTPALYWWEMRGGLLDTTLMTPDPGATHAQFVRHLILFSLLIVATFIDIDEKTIPDAITVPGTLIALVLTALMPVSLLPIPMAMIGRGGGTVPLLLSSPRDWPDGLDEWPGLVIGLSCFVAWCYAILPKTWWTRGGWRKTLRYLLASIARHPLTVWISGLAILGSLAITAVWYVGGGLWRQSWQALLSALVGMAFGGGLVWLVRVVAGRMLGREAMGFGDVTLMAMIGAFLGWQPSLIIFFLAPFAGLLIALLQWMLTGRKDIAYGPFLCAATLLLVLCWPAMWKTAVQYFDMGLFIPAIVLASIALMGVMLGAYRWAWGRATPKS